MPFQLLPTKLQNKLKRPLLLCFNTFLPYLHVIANVNKVLKLYNNLKKTCKKFAGNKTNRTFVIVKQQHGNRS